MEYACRNDDDVVSSLGEVSSGELFTLLVGLGEQSRGQMAVGVLRKLELLLDHRKVVLLVSPSNAVPA